MSELFPESPLTSLPAAVAAMGALPVPVGPKPKALSEERELEIRSLDLLALMSDRAAPVVSGHLTALLDEVARLRTERAAIGDEVARFGIVGAALPATRALVKRADELVTENAELRSQVAELNESVSSAAEALRARQSCPCPPEIPPAPHQVGCFFDGVPVSPPSERPVDDPSPLFPTVASLREVSSREEPHDSPLHQTYRIPHDLPLGCGLTDAQVEQLGNPFLDGGA